MILAWLKSIFIQHTILVTGAAGLIVVGGSAAIIIAHFQSTTNPTTTTLSSSAESGNKTSTSPKSGNSSTSQNQSSAVNTPTTSGSSSTSTAQTRATGGSQTSGNTSQNQTSGADASTGGTTNNTSGNTGGFQANCINVPSACGYPDSTNTGVPAGTALTHVPQDVSSGSGWYWRSDTEMIIVNTAGTTLSNLDIAGAVQVNADNVTIQNTRITSGSYYPVDSQGTNLVVKDTQIIATWDSTTSCIAFDNYTALRVDCSGAADGFKVESNVIVRDSYVHNLAVTADSHNDGIQSISGVNDTIQHNTIKLSTSPGANACIQFGDTHSNWLVTDNLFDGGGYSLNGGQNYPTSLQITNNRFTRNSVYGPVSMGGITWSGNYFDDNNDPVSL